MSHNTAYWNNYDYDLPTNDLEKIDDFKALAGPSIDEMHAIEDARARNELVATVYNLLNDISGKFVIEKMGFSNPQGQLPSDQIIQAFKNKLIDFTNQISTSKHPESPAMGKALASISQLKDKAYKAPWEGRDQSYYDNLDLLDLAQDMQKAHAQSINIHRWS